MNVRVCAEADLPDLRAGWPTVDDVHGAHLEEQRNGTATYLVAWEGGEPLGSGLVQWRGPVGSNARAAFPGCVELNHLHVRAGLRGQGIGTSLIVAAEDLARGLGHEQIAVGVAIDNSTAARLYEGLGYLPTAIVDATAYDWTDDDGQVHHENETNRLLIKQL